LPPQRLSGCCRFSQRTFARTHGNERDAPKPVVPVSENGRRLSDPRLRFQLWLSTAAELKLSADRVLHQFL
jgi:hypothetical protein